MYIIGILIGLYLNVSIVFLCICHIIIFIFLCLYNVDKKWIAFLSFVLIGCIYVNVLNKDYETRYANISEEVNIKAVIVSEPIDKDYKNTYTVKVEEINGDKKYKNTKLLLDIKKSALKEELQFGDEIEIIGKLKKPNGARNYKGFDYKQYLKSKKIYGTISLTDYEIISKNKIDVISKMINSIQNNMKSNINKILNEEEAALCIGILVGDREAISEQTENNFKKSNLTHMLAVSGSHITYIINALAILLGKTNKKIAKIFTIFILIFFMALTGFTSSVIRACIMGILVLLASIMYRRPDTINNLGISSFIILLFNPYAICDVGFLLSYCGTIGIVLLGDKITNGMYRSLSELKKITFFNKNIVIEEKNTKKQFANNIKKESNIIINKIAKYIIMSFSITLSANLIIIPVMAYNFSTISFTFWISNILAAPIMEVVTILGFIIYFISIIFLPLAKFIGVFLNSLLYLLLKIAEISSLIPGASIYIKTPYIAECVIYYLFILLWIEWGQIKNTLKEKIFDFIEKLKREFLNKRVNLIVVPSSIFVIIFSSIFICSFPKKLKIYFVDVGQGDCTLIETPTNKHILIDGGGSEFGNFDVGESTLLPYLLDRRITTIDYMLISHFDSDHIDGLFAIIKNLKVKNIIISKQGEKSDNFIRFQELVRNRKVNVLVVKKGDWVQIDKYSYFEILFPEENLIQDNILNNNSIVATFCSMGLKMLFTGDIEEVAEDRLYELYKNTGKLKSTILKVAHHGSKTSSTAKFLELVSPKAAFIGVGEGNKFGHPNDGVIDRIRGYTNKIYRTDKKGEIELIYIKGKIKINSFV